MKAAIWTYPWDLLDEGVETVADRLSEMGMTKINLATNYHSVQTFLPHNPKRRTFFAHASSYLHPSGRYGDIKPVPNETMGDDDWLARIEEEIADTHLTLNSWTVGCHNSRLGMERPDLTLETPPRRFARIRTLPVQPGCESVPLEPGGKPRLAGSV